MLFGDDRFADYKVSLKHKWLRLAAFIFFVILAIGGITNGVLQLSKKDAGFYTIDASVDSEAVTYAKNTEFHYYMEGRTSEIKDTTRQVTLVYSQALLHAYKMLDADNTYVGYENIASINLKRGEYVNVSNELYSILKDAYDKTMEQKGYNMFAGLLYEHWANILILYDYENFDPLVNEDEKNTIKAISEMVNNLDNFKLDFNDTDKSVKLTVSKEYEAFCEKLELTNKVLDLNLMQEAYTVDYVARALEEAGYRKGYITTTKGLTVSLSELTGCQYPIYGMDNGDIVIKEIIDAEPGSVLSSFNHFQKKETDILYQRINVNGSEYYRSPFINLSENGYNNLYLSTNVITDTIDPIVANYLNIQLISATTMEDYENTLSAQTEINQSLKTKIQIVVY